MKCPLPNPWIRDVRERQSINAECGSGWGARRERGGSGRRDLHLSLERVCGKSLPLVDTVLCVPFIHCVRGDERSVGNERRVVVTPGGSYWFETRQFRHHHGREKDHTWWSWCRGRTSSEERRRRRSGSGSRRRRRSGRRRRRQAQARTQTRTQSGSVPESHPGTVCRRRRDCGGNGGGEATSRRFARGWLWRSSA